MDRTEGFRIRGVQTIPFIERHQGRDVPHRSGEHDIDRYHAGAVHLPPAARSRDRLLSYIGDVVVNGNPQAKGFEVKEPFAPIAELAYNGDQELPAGTRQILPEKGPKKFAGGYARKSAC